MKIAFLTLGCKVNQYETEALREIFISNGWIEGNFYEKCDAYVINTCTVTSMSDRKSRQMIRRAVRNNLKGIVAVCGCYSEVFPDDVKKIEGVDIIIGTKNKNSLYEKICEKAGIGNKCETKDEITCFEGKTRAVIKIEDGCNNFCSYCIIPYARGRIVSRNEENIISECNRIAKSGFKEAVLAGIHVCSYGKDTGSSLINLLERLEKETDIERIRLSSVEPNAFFDGFIKRLSELKKICPHFHISLQSGCTDTLKRMNRRYSPEEYKKICDELIKVFPGCAITTDVIVGFPGETDEEFKESEEFIRSIPFYKIHTFKYSPREGTLAAKMAGQIPPEIQEERSKRIIEISDEKTKEFVKNSIGSKPEILVEKFEDGICTGRAKNYQPFKFQSDKDLSNTVVKKEIKEENLIFETYR